MKKSNLIKFATAGLLTAFALGCDNNPTGGNGNGNGNGGGNNKKTISSWNADGPLDLVWCAQQASMDAQMSIDQGKDYHAEFVKGSRNCVNQHGGTVTIRYDDGSELLIR